MNTLNIQSLCRKSKRFPEIIAICFLNWLSGSNYPCPERISLVQKMFEPLRFDCICSLNFATYSFLFLSWPSYFDVYGKINKIKL